MKTLERTIVGVPFHERESQIALDSTLNNINTCLNYLKVDAPVMILVNGRDTANGSPPPLTVEQSKYNAKIQIIQGSKAGQVNAINDIVNNARMQKLRKLFITDADIYRFPEALAQMWAQADVPLVGAHYAVYPSELVDQKIRPLTEKERFLYRMFEGDKPFQVKEAIERHIGKKRTRVKGSLMLVDLELAQRMHKEQTLASDSIINRVTANGQSKIAEGAYFMHCGRISLDDHVKARLRHYRGAAAVGELNSFRKSQPSIAPEIADVIAQDIRKDNANGTDLASYFLLRTALRKQVDEACLEIASQKLFISKTRTSGEFYPRLVALNYQQANAIVQSLLDTLDWNTIQEYSTTPAETTQLDLSRKPLDLTPYLKASNYKGIILDSLGIKH